MRAISTTTSVAIGFACIICSAVLAAHMFGLLPDRAATVAREHLRLAQVVAAQCSAAADQNDAASIRTTLSVLLANNSDVLSAGVRAPNGKLVVEAGPHKTLWADAHSPGHAKVMEIQVPVFQKNQEWATIEMAFAPLPDSGVFANPLLRLTLFLCASGFTGSLFFLRRALKHLDPSSVIPDRVRAMLDALAEGVIIMDKNEQIVMANQAFSEITGLTLTEILGRRIANIAALVGEQPEQCEWLAALRKEEHVRRMGVRLAASNKKERALVLNAVPIHGPDGSRRGLLVTFDDVTSIEAANAELARSRDEIERKNLELEALASHDSLTGCLNRRAFMRLFDNAWNDAEGTSSTACIMLDIDHFKQVNDRYGHATGDQVLKQMGQTLQRVLRTDDRVCRYGGEEFCVLLPNTTFEEAFRAATRLREAIISTQWPISAVTASIGVSAREAGATEVHQMLEQADQALYAAKRTGRDRVICWGDPVVGEASAKAAERRDAPAGDVRSSNTAEALIDMLRRRDPATNDHCRRVTELAVNFARHERLLNEEQLRLLQVAGQLHDVGKVAIPDAILQKPGPLTKEEWAIMQTHAAVGAEIVDRALGNAALTEIVSCHHAWFAGRPAEPHLPTRENLRLETRILSLADAFDAMTTDRPYRQGMDAAAAGEELRRFAGTQFDPELVERFAGWLSQAKASIAKGLHHLQMSDVHAANEAIAQSVAALSAEVKTDKCPVPAVNSALAPARQ